MNYTNLLLTSSPDLLVVAGLFAALGCDYGLFRSKSVQARSSFAAMISMAVLAGAVLLLVFQAMHSANLSEANIVDYYNGQIFITPLTLAFKIVVYLMAVFIIVASVKHMPNSHVSEYYALILLSAIGMSFLVTSGNLIMLFVSLELVSLSLYALAAFHYRSLYSVEAGLKYFTFGGVSSGFLLFGLSYLYGATHELNIAKMGEALLAMTELSPLIVIAVIFVLVGFGFKISAAPFHQWAPDVYQCAPVPVAAWIATGSKVASVFALVTLLSPVLSSDANRFVALVALAAIATCSMVVGNLGALRQRCLKRLLAYSSIAHAGYILVGLTAATPEGSSSVLFYSLVYALSTLGAFGVVGVISDRLGREALMSDLSGYWKKKPGLSILLLIFILSLAGIPPLSGFVGKFYLFLAAIGGHTEVNHFYDGVYWLVGIALIMSIVSLYYYLQVLKYVFVSEDTPSAVTEYSMTREERMGLIVIAILVVALGLFPAPVVNFILAFI